LISRPCEPLVRLVDRFVGVGDRPIGPSP
jgi:hypothetical protein